ncbi:IclR family transcriptional regulator [Macrococcoides canis]|uniref:IclR family transcriptional regulator n=1 Tax=Macrococcoides canis TaxID=1855823 RepID=UPI0020B76A89|nr:IclR family transcriptional regulator C-terminal domain-containing protein [Macrococcus canis]UTH12017.1 hypothetical protein KFV10_02585 [Macrococcus canis]
MTLKNLTLSNQILRLFVFKNKSLTAQEIIREMNAPKSVVYRILKTHVDQGILQSIGKGYYQPGWIISELSHLLSTDTNMHDIAVPLLEEASEQLKETIILTKIVGKKVYVIESISPNKDNIFTFKKGEVLPPYYGASSKTLLAFANENYQKDVLSMIKNNQNKEKIIKDLLEIQANGFAMTFEEVDKGAMAIGVPVINKNRLIGGISVAMKMSDQKKVDHKHTVALLKKISNDISFYLDQ